MPEPLKENHRHGGTPGDGRKLLPSSIDGLLNFIQDAVPASNAAVKIGTQAIPGSAGNQVVTGIGFQPDVVLFFAYGQGTTNPDSSGVALTGASLTKQVAANNEKEITSSKCISLEDSLSSSTRDTRASLASLDSDGFTLSWLVTGTVYGGTYIYICLKLS